MSTENAPSAEALRREVLGADLPFQEPDAYAELDDTLTELLDERGLPREIDRELVTTNLDELALLLTSLRGGMTGEQFRSDLVDVFDEEISPGTIYPVLHDLEDEGALQMTQLVRTKRYNVADADAAYGRFEAAMRQHLALALLFRRAMADVEA